jgi:hypothetical protein
MVLKMDKLQTFEANKETHRLMIVEPNIPISMHGKMEKGREK